MKTTEKITPASFLQTVSANVNNSKLSDEDFRQFIRNSLSIVDFPPAPPSSPYSEEVLMEYWQSLVDPAYDRWQKHDNSLQERYNNKEINAREFRALSWSFEEMLDNCDKAERAACVLAKLSQQIDNGGVSQWVDNGYAVDSMDWLEKHFAKLGPVSAEIWTLLKNYYDEYTEGGEFKRFDDDEDDVDSLWRDACAASDVVSNKFYKLQKSWYPEVYDYLRSL